ncbi:aspartyl/asparaginyl beta-hydroxylase isoform X7, partial [Lates japonicus]
MNRSQKKRAKDDVEFLSSELCDTPSAHGWLGYHPGPVLYVETATCERSGTHQHTIKQNHESVRSQFWGTSSPLMVGMRVVHTDETPGDTARRGAKKETSPTKDVGLKLREALKQQLAIIHERVEAKKLAKLALAEVRHLLAKEEEEKELELGRKEITARVKERVAARLKEEEEKIEKEETEKALEKLRLKEKAVVVTSRSEEAAAPVEIPEPEPTPEAVVEPDPVPVEEVIEAAVAEDTSAPPP